MTKEEFVQQVRRIENQFGSYGTERAAILWKEVNHFSSEWFQKAVDRQIGSSRLVPLPSDFYEDISREREKISRAEKIRNREEAKIFFFKRHQNGEIQAICDFIIRRMKGEVPDELYLRFQKNLENSVE